MLLTVRLVERVPLDAEGDVEAGAVVLPGADGGHLNDDVRREVLAQSPDQRLVDRRRCGRRALGVFERGSFGVAEPRAVTPTSCLYGLDLGVADVVLAAPGSVEVLSEWATDDGTDAKVEQVAEPAWRLARAPEPARHRRRAARDGRDVRGLAQGIQDRSIELDLCLGQFRDLRGQVRIVNIGQPRHGFPPFTHEAIVARRIAGQATWQEGHSPSGSRATWRVAGRDNGRLAGRPSSGKGRGEERRWLQLIGGPGRSLLFLAGAARACRR